VGLPGVEWSRDELAAIGVKRISIGSGLARAAFSAFLRAGTEMREHGTFTFAQGTVSLSEIGELFAEF
jgi:2-methylisocitrate lyase-like PEP mutase family enzyme